MDRFSRRIFLQVSGGAALAPGASGAVTHPVPPAPPAATADHTTTTYRFLNRDEAAFIEAAVTRLIPPDDVGPSALEAGVPDYIDLQLHGAWGAGERLYRSGPWARGRPTQGYQLPFTPAELFRTAMRAIHADLQTRHQASFQQLDGARQDAYLTLLQTSTLDLDGVPSNVFFESLLAMTIEGYFSDPAYGGNRGMAAWRMIGFPGAYGSYHDLVDQHGVAFTAAPVSLSQARDGHVHVTPDIPAVAPLPSSGPGKH